MSSRLNHIRNWEALARKANYQLSVLAGKCHVTIRQLERYFADNFNVTPHTWINALRLTEAAMRISRGEPIKSVAYELNFKQASYFTRAFRRASGLNPHTYLAANAATRGKCRLKISNVGKR